MTWYVLALWIFPWQPHFFLPSGAVANEEIVLRWIHFVSGIIWIGLLYFFNLVARGAMQEMKPAGKLEMYPALMSRAMAWFRWSALITVLAGLRYFIIILRADAANSGHSGLAWRWLGWWFLVWIAAYVLIYPLQLPASDRWAGGWKRVLLIVAIVFCAAWAVLWLNSGPQSSNGHMSISVGGGLGLLMLLNAWGVVWRAQKRLIRFYRESAESGTLLPPDAARLARWSFLASRTAFWISFPMLFFMAAADHYPFLSSIVD